MDSIWNRRLFVSRLGRLLGALPLTASAQPAQPSRVQRIGILSGNSQIGIAEFKGELTKLGYVEGRNLAIETRLVQRNPAEMAAYASELGRMDLQLVFVVALPHALAMREANAAMPMVIGTCPGMVSNGFAASLEHPGGNATGIDELPPGVTGKRMTLLKTAAPAVSRIALLSTTPGRGGHETQLAEATKSARDLGVEIKPYRATTVSELDGALQAIAADRMNGLVSFQGALSLGNRQTIVDFAAKQAIPAIYQATLFAEAGGLMTWAPSLEDQFVEAARYVDQILKGAKPGDLPIRYPARYYLTIHRGTAKSLGLTIPEALRAQADRLL